MNVSFIHRWIFATIILIGTTLPIDVLATSTSAIYQTESVNTKKSLTKIIRYQKAKQLFVIHPFLHFDFNQYQLHQFQSTKQLLKQRTQLYLPVPIFFTSFQITNQDDSDNLNG